MILGSKKESTKFQVLVEIASHQPDIRQKEIADRIGITPQAVSEYIKELSSDGFLYSDGRVSYRISKKGIEWITEKAVELKKYARSVIDDIVRQASVWTAIANKDLRKGDVVSLRMEGGLLYADPPGGGATGVTISNASEGEDVGITDLKGMISPGKANITICKVPRVERGGSRRVDLALLKKKLRISPISQLSV